MAGMTLDKAGVFKKDAGRLRDHRSLYESIWQEIADLIIPRKNQINTITTPGSGRTRRLFDSTALEANVRLAASIGGNVTPAGMKWFDFDLPTPMTYKRTNAFNGWLKEAGDVTADEINQSNFNAEVAEVWQDVTAFGNGALFIDEKENGKVRFHAYSNSEYAIDEDFEGVVNKFVRHFESSLQRVANEFGTKGFTPDMLELLKDKPEKTIDVLHYICERNVAPKEFEYATNKPVISLYVDLTNMVILDEGGYMEFPVAIARWSKLSNETYGRGLGEIALPDTQSVNRAEELALRAWAMAIMPPLLGVHDALLTRPDLRPSRLNMVTQPDALQFLVPATRLDIETVKREDKRNSIRRIFFMDQVQFVPDRGKTPPTLGEIQARLNIMLQILGPTLARLEWEFLTVTINRVFSILLRAKRIPPAPPEVSSFAKTANGRINLVFVGPIAAAKRQSESAAILNVLQTAGNFAQAFPDIVDNIESDEAMRMLARNEGAPTAIIRKREGEGSVEAIREARASREQQMQEQEVDAQDAESLGKIAPLLNQGA